MTRPVITSVDVITPGGATLTKQRERLPYEWTDRLREQHADLVISVVAVSVFRGLWSTSCGSVTLGHANRTRLRRSSNPARPNIWRLSILILLTW
ncbi:hypothetical protein, partial [Streptomyces lunaelactis]|uniref:hypothetical protein n=1 Tax=Streptomyces lunaelactis TaxID=1535768 RepID=UPI001C2F5D74